MFVICIVCIVLLFFLLHLFFFLVLYGIIAIVVSLFVAGKTKYESYLIPISVFLFVFCFAANFALCLSLHSYHCYFIFVILFLSFIVEHVTLLLLVGYLVLAVLCSSQAVLVLFLLCFFLASFLSFLFFVFFQNTLKLQENGLLGVFAGTKKTRQEGGPRSLFIFIVCCSPSTFGCFLLVVGLSPIFHFLPSVLLVLVSIFFFVIHLYSVCCCPFFFCSSAVSSSICFL